MTAKPWLFDDNLSDAEAIARLVAAAPPLTAEQCASLAAQCRRDQEHLHRVRPAQVIERMAAA